MTLAGSTVIPGLSSAFYHDFTVKKRLYSKDYRSPMAIATRAAATQVTSLMQYIRPDSSCVEIRVFIPAFHTRQIAVALCVYAVCWTTPPTQPPTPPT